MAREGSLRRSTSVLTKARRLGRKILRWLEGDSRSQQLRDEVLFWRHWFSTQGSFWPEDYKERLDPNLPIQDHVGRYVDRLTTNPVYILDVGAGPLTKLGKVHASKEIMITATDLLATEYDQVLRDFGIQPLVRTVFGDAENLSTQFGDYSFDIVHGQNCIDHTASPLKAIQQMLSVTKHDGFVVLYHAENEGKTESYKQLHKWDFTCEKGHFVIRGPGPGGDSVDATDALAAVGLLNVAWMTARCLLQSESIRKDVSDIWPTCSQAGPPISGAWDSDSGHLKYYGITLRFRFAPSGNGGGDINAQIIIPKLDHSVGFDHGSSLHLPLVPLLHQGHISFWSLISMYVWLPCAVTITVEEQDKWPVSFY